MSGKFDIQKIIEDVKSVITPVPIPEANKDDPAAYYLSELNKLAKELADAHTKQADIIAKINPLLGSLYKEVKGDAPPPKAEAAPAAEGEEKASEAEVSKEEDPAEEGGKEGEAPCCGDTEEK